MKHKHTQLLITLRGPAAFAHVTARYIIKHGPPWESLADTYIEQALETFDDESVARIISTWLNHYNIAMLHDGTNMPVFKQFYARVRMRMQQDEISTQPYV